MEIECRLFSEVYATPLLLNGCFFVLSLYFFFLFFLFFFLFFSFFYNSCFLNNAVPVATFLMAVICVIDKLRCDVFLNMLLVSVGRWCLMISNISTCKSFTLVLFFFFKCFFIMWIRWNWNVNKFKKTDNIKKFHISYTIRLFFFLSQIFIFGIISIAETLSVGSFTRCSS